MNAQKYIYFQLHQKKPDFLAPILLGTFGTSIEYLGHQPKKTS